MGTELSAYPGVHLLLIFHESVKPEAVECFLADLYGKPYSDIAGKPGPITVVPVEDLLDRVSDTFGDQAMVIAPHVESGGGVYQVLRDLHQILMPVLRHNALCALSFNKVETREKLKDLFTQPHYARTRPIAMIQSSDAHGSRGSVGQPRTEVRISGQPTFTAVREAFSAGRLKCSVDFVSEDYSRIVEGELVRKFTGSEQETTFKQEDREDLVRFFCAALNSGKGIVELDLVTKAEQELKEFYPERIREDLKKLLDDGLEPAGIPLLTRALVFSSTRVRILIKPSRYPGSVPWAASCISLKATKCGRPERQKLRPGWQS